MSGQFESCVFVSRGNKNNDGPDFRGQEQLGGSFVAVT